MHAPFRSALLSLILAAGLAEAQEPPASAIRDTIRSQFEAFLRGDAAGAFAFASPTIKGMFVTPERFGQMVRNGYPMVWQPGEVRFLGLREVAGRLWQRVMVTDAAGRTHVLDYEMIETPEGWQIDAVLLLPEGGVGA